MTWLSGIWNRLRSAGAVVRRRRFPRWLLVVLGGLLGLELLYLVGVNLFLNLGGLPLAFSSTNQVSATISSGFSFWPGRVHAKNVRFTFQDHNVQFSLDMASAFLVIELGELAHHTVHVSHLRGEAVVYRMRHRIDPWSKHEQVVGTFPPIPEYPTPAVFEARVPEAPLSDAEYNLWTVHFDDVDASVSEVWVQAFRYRGKGRVRGQFQLKPARSLWVGPASLALEPGLLSAGPYRVAPDFHGRVDCTVHPFDVRPVQGFEPLRYISAHVRLDSAAFDPRAFQLLSGERAPRVSSSGGSLHVDVRTKHGVLTRQSRVDLVQRGFEARAVQGELDADQLEVHGALNDRGETRATLLIERGTLREPIAPGHAPRIEYLAASVASGNRDTSKPFGLLEARLDEARLEVLDANWLNRWLKDERFALTGGALSVNARARYADSLLDGQAVLESDGLGASLDGKSLHYAGALSVGLERADLQASTGTLSADLSGRSLRAELGGSAGQMHLSGLQAHLQASRDAEGTAFDARAKLWDFRARSKEFMVRAPGMLATARSERLADGTQLTHFKAEIPTLQAEGRAARLTTAARARGTFAQPKSRPEQRLELWASLTRPRAWLGEERVNTVATPRVDLHAALRTDALGALSGTLGLEPAAWVVEAKNLRLTGKSSLSAKFAALDLGRHSGAVSVRLKGKGITLGDTTQNANCPWSRVDSLQLDGDAKLLERGATTLALGGELKQTELAWGDFLTRGDIGLDARFEQGLLTGDGAGRIDLKLRQASIQSGGGGNKGWAATVPVLEVSTKLVREAGKLAGTARVSAPRARGRVGSTHVRTDLVADLELDTLNLEANTLHGSGAVHLRNAALPNAPEPISDWWADVNLDSLFARAQRNLELGGTFHANLRDATPGLAVLSSQGELPEWVASAFPLRGLSVTGSLARRCRLTDIHLVQVSGGPAVARGRLQSVPDGFQGALLVRLAGLEAISAGIDFDAEHTDFAMFRGDGWLSRLDHGFDQESEKAVKLACPPDPNTCSEPEPISVVASDAR